MGGCQLGGSGLTGHKGGQEASWAHRSWNGGVLVFLEKSGGEGLGASLVEGIIMGDLVKSLRGIYSSGLSNFSIKP